MTPEYTTKVALGDSMIAAANETKTSADRKGGITCCLMCYNEMRSLFSKIDNV